jgi:hypothetical protein
MRSIPSRLLLSALLLLPLLSTACVTRSTPTSIARTERAALPPLPADLTRTEQLTPLTAKPAGEVVTIDRGILSEIVERFAEAIGAVERGNARAVAVALERRCTTALLATGQLPAECPR